MAYRCLAGSLTFAGLDIDWEYPKDDGEASDFVRLLEETRKVHKHSVINLSSSRSIDTRLLLIFSRRGQNAVNRSMPRWYSVSLSLIFKSNHSTGPQNYEKLHLKEMDHYLDFWNVMAYDYAGTFSNVAGHQANLYPSTSNPDSTPFSTSAAIEYYKSKGIAGTKLVLGMPIYGRAFASTDGPGQPFSGGGEGSWEQGIWDYKVLPQNEATEMYNDEAGASWSFDSGKRLMVSYDSKEMVGKKVDYIKNEGLGGAMWWESSADKKGDESLIGIVSLLVIGRLNLVLKRSTGRWCAW